MSRIISKAEGWERAYEVFQQVNFSAFDFNTIKESMIEYMKLYFPEDFNDYIESSEFIALLELFAYTAELLAYRLDLNAHENFLTTAQRKESVLRLAKLISYKASRNIPARGLAKIQSIQTTEAVTDANGINLANTRIRWNDRNNANWKDQFILIINRVLQQPFGSVSPEERVQVQDVVFELYDLNNNTTISGTQAFSTQVSGQSVNMEIVPQELAEFGPIERRPQQSKSLALTFASDGLGDGSDTTGFMFFVKQGKLNRQVFSFDGVTPNQTFALANVGINDTDLWVNNVDADTGEILTDGLWEEVDIAASQNIIFNTTDTRNKFEVETLDEDGVRVIFGDGEFATIPSGTFDFWNRTSLTTPVVIPQNTIQGQVATFTYQDVNGNVQTVSFTFSLINTLQNAAATETIDHIRRTAPSVYYTQDRMVNAQDYNTFLLQDPTIAKLRAVNRTFAGDSKFIAWHDPSESYENVKIFGNDLLLYFNTDEASLRANASTSVDVVIDSIIEPILSTAEFSNILNSEGVAYNNVRREFTAAERTDIETALTNAVPASPTTVHLFYSVRDDSWEPRTGQNVGGDNLVLTDPPQNTDPLWLPLKDADLAQSAGSPISSLWGSHGSPATYSLGSIVSFFGSPETLLRYFEATGSPTTPGNRPLGSPTQWSEFATEGIIQVEFDSSIGWTVNWKTTRLVAESQSSSFWNTNDGNTVVTFDALNNAEDRIVILQANVNPDYDTTDTCGSPAELNAGDILPGNVPLVILQQENDANGLPDINILSVIPEDDNVDGVPDFCKTINDVIVNVNDLIAPSRATALTTPFNFGWFHFTVDRNLVDPAPSNIIDIFIITRGYIENLKLWINGVTSIEPAAPTPLQLRSDYGTLLENKMISDTVVLRTGIIRLLFGTKAETELRGQFKVIKNPLTPLTDNQIKTRIVDVVQDFFNIDLWEFGETFYFTELAAAIHSDLSSDIDSVVLVPTLPANQFGDLFQVEAREDEVFQPDIAVDDILIVTSLTTDVLQQDPA